MKNRVRRQCIGHNLEVMRKPQIFKLSPTLILKKRIQAIATYLKVSPFVSALIFIFATWNIISMIVLYFERSAEGHNINNVEESIWWGIVTLLTVGYGDKYPVTTEGRFFAGLLMVSGVVGIAIVTAKISSYFLERALRERRGFVDANLLHNHFIICGWKSEMITFLLNVLDSTKGMRAEDIVLLNSAPDSEIESMLEVPRLKKVKVVKGDFYIEVNLKKVAPEKAMKVLILADATPGAGGKVPTLTEADARTIMTAMTLNSIAKGTPVAAEILDGAMDQYLRLAQVNEIVYTRDYSRMLVAMSSTGTGVTNIFHELLSPHSPYFITTHEIPEELHQQTYAKLQELFSKDRPHQTLVGILENSGNSHVAKENAIRKAQQTPNVAQLVANLQGVKTLKFNQPLFGPRPDYVIRDNCMAIVIENRNEVKHG
jgi:voltage-gated potassium channel